MSARLFRFCSKFFLLLAAVQVLGGHWAVLQSVAWTKMLIDYAQSDSLTVAVAKTFDGAHPCSLCQTVKAGRKTEQQKEAVTAIEKLDAVLVATVQIPPRREAARKFFPVALEKREVAHSPLTPPPRRA